MRPAYTVKQMASIAAGMLLTDGLSFEPSGVQIVSDERLHMKDRQDVALVKQGSVISPLL